jgi:hypothetical protein
LAVSGVFPRETTTVFGGKSGWQTLSLADGIARSTGQFGYESLELAPNDQKADEASDCFFDFERERTVDSAGHYRVIKEPVSYTRGIMGTGAALFSGNGGIRLRGGQSSLFGAPGLMGSFTMEFWLKPAIVENGEVILNWQSSRIINGYPQYQSFGTYFFNNKMAWNATNIFEGYTSNGGEVQISSSRVIVPEVWARHSISFDETTGLLEYRIDGVLEAVRYLTSTGTESGDIFQPHMGDVSELEICSAYSGALDSLHFRRDFRAVEYTADYTVLPGGGRANLYNPAGGRFETQPVRTLPGSGFKSLSVIAGTPKETAVQYFVRAGEDIYNWTDSFPAWVPVEPGKDTSRQVTGEYFQAAAALYPDGAGARSPSVTQISLVIDEMEPPLPPFLVRAEIFDSAVTVSWRSSPDTQGAAYYVYYGERPGEYLGRIAREGPSPVSAGQGNSVTLNGLQNGKIYYFAVAACSKSTPQLMGELSAEIPARPLAGKGAPNDKP